MYMKNNHNNNSENNNSNDPGFYLFFPIIEWMMIIQIKVEPTFFLIEKSTKSQASFYIYFLLPRSQKFQIISIKILKF
jgi:hypothetical protein